ncbi:tetratricopeptide repeat protein [Marinobacter koreensis]|uniref:Tetratricopeptide repeat protein n=2 Tax=Marinobacter koreensis TaxID=335974 RepID=A0ABW0RQ87_9GAMM|nr:tetratricopeptide repeat protein [Marinobacter koreensis]MCK7548863.1 tetratricopeptide repeat protein [Marinobacter koreensis]
MNRILRAWVLFGGVSLAGCASLTGQPTTVGMTGDGPGGSCRTDVRPEEQLELDAVDAQMKRDQPYAALARLEESSMGAEQHWLRLGQLYVQTGQLSKAGDLFSRLSQRCQSADSYHGLGLVALKQGRLQDGLDAMKTARDKSPSSVDIRNDYGYALLNAGQNAEAVFELRTAFELADGKGAVRQNLAAAYLITNDQAGLTRLKKQYGFSPEELAYARQLAEHIRRLQ